MKSNVPGRARASALLAGMLIAALVEIAQVIPAQAQLSASGGDPTNLSKSGSASLSTVGVAPNGTLHALWWDQIDGTRYARGTIGDSAAAWTKSTIVPAMVAFRRTDQATKTTTIGAPKHLQLLVDRVGVAHATWFDDQNQLMYSQLPASANASWSAPSALSPKAASVAMTLDMSGTLQMVYAQTSSTDQSPAGMYYLSRNLSAFKRSVVYTSTYFRTAQPEDLSLSLARDLAGNVLVAWHAAREDQSVQVLSTDGGTKWHTPEPIAPRNQVFGLPVKVSVAASGPGQFLILWRDASAPGCGLTQKRTSDAGATWTVPERVLSSLVRCPGQLTLVGGNDPGTLILIGKPAADGEGKVTDSTGTLAVWDGTSWGAPLSVNVSYKDPVTNDTRSLGCLDMALTSGNLALVGCDVRSDVWAKGQHLDAASLVQAAPSTWGKQTRLAGAPAVGVTKDVHITSDPATGISYAVWSQAVAPSAVATAIKLAVYKDSEWTDPVTVTRVTGDVVPSQDVMLAQTEQPALTMDRANKLHMVWSGGSAGRVFYMNAFIRDANFPSRWSKPVPLPAPTLVGSNPTIAENPRTNTLYVLYAVPFNEKRGVYLTHSTDGGTTWLTEKLVFDAQAAGWDAVDSLQLVIDAAGVMHAAWMKSPLPGATGARVLYYARSTDGGNTWSSPQPADQGVIGTPHLVAYGQNQLMLTWLRKSANVTNTQAPWQVWWQLSPDAGLHWTKSNIVTGFEAVSGGFGLAASAPSNVNLTALAFGRSNETTVLFSQWTGSAWTPTDITSLSTPSALGNDITLASDPAHASLIAAMRVAVLQPDGSRAFAPIGLSRTAVMTSTGSVPSATVVALPTFTSAPKPDTSTDMPSFAPTPLPTISVGNISTTQAQSGPVQNTLLVSGLIAAAVVVAGSILVGLVRRRR